MLACTPEQKPQSPIEKNLKALAVYYGGYTGQNKGVGPPNEEAFKKFIRTRTPPELENFGVDPANLDPLFISPRDNQPYGIAWGLRGAMPGPNGAGMVIWEQTGVNGKRYVADSIGKIEEVDEATWTQRLPKSKSGKLSVFRLIFGRFFILFWRCHVSLSPKPATGLYAHRVARGHRHYRDLDRLAIASRSKGPRGGQSNEVRQSPQANRDCHPQLQRHKWSFAGRWLQSMGTTWKLALPHSEPS